MAGDSITAPDTLIRARMLSEPLLFVSCPPSIADAIGARVRSAFQGCSTRRVVITLDLTSPALADTLACAPTVALAHVLTPVPMPLPPPLPVPVPGFSDDRASLADSTIVIGLTPHRVEQARIGRDHVCIDCLQHWLRTAQGDRHGRVPPVDIEAITPDTVALAARLATHWLSPDILDHGDGETADGEATEGSAPSQAGATAAAECEPALVEIDARTGLRTRHPIVRRRDCTRCRHWRAIPPADLRAHYSARTGIVTLIERFSDRVPSVAAAGAAAVHPLATPPAVRRAAAGTFGYGATVREAENGCIGEALERYCATFHTHVPLHRTTLDEVRGASGSRGADEPGEREDAIDPRDILLFSDTQYRERVRRNPRLPPRHRIPEPFDPRQPLDWLAGRDLVSNRRVWVPAACCLLDYPFPPGDAPFAGADLSGCASGRTDADAILHGLLEIVERDAHAIWWYNRLARPAIALEAIDDARLIEIRDQLAALGHQLTLLDVTTDIGIESCIGLITTRDGRQPVLGSAAHPERRVAAVKAASEAVLNWYCARGGQLPADIAHWVATASVDTAPFLRGTCDERTPARASAVRSEHGVDQPDDDAALISARPRDQPRTPTQSHAHAQAQAQVQRQLHDCVSRLHRIGLRPVAIELTRPDVVVPVWRIIVPGLRHVYDRRAHGRLYDVPVRAGWLRAALEESELNALPCTF